MEKSIGRICLLFILVIGLSACAERRNNSGLIQTQTPDYNKYISGIINGNKYYAMDNTFSISLPYKKGTLEYNLMDIDEYYHESGSNVTFGPFGNNKSIYNIELYRVKKENNRLKTFEAKSLKLLSKYHNNLYKSISMIKVLNKKHIKLNGNRTIHWNLLKKVRARSSEYKLVRHHVFAIKLRYYIALVMVEKAADIPDGENFASAYDFAFSLSLLENNQKQISAIP